MARAATKPAASKATDVSRAATTPAVQVPPPARIAADAVVSLTTDLAPTIAPALSTGASTHVPAVANSKSAATPDPTAPSDSAPAHTWADGSRLPMAVDRHDNAVWISPSGRIFSSPNMTVWPDGVGADGPSTIGSQGDWWTQLSNGVEGRPDGTPVRNPFVLQWHNPDHPWNPLLPDGQIPTVGVLQALAPPTSTEALLIRQGDAAMPRQSLAWVALESMLLRIAPILFARHGFAMEYKQGLRWKTVGHPSWWNQWHTDERNAAWIARIVHLMLFKLAAAVSLYCAITLHATGDRTRWRVLLNNAGLNSHSDQQFLDGLANTWVCRFEGVRRRGVFVDVSNFSMPRLLLVYLLADVPLYLYWGTDREAIPRMLHSYDEYGRRHTPATDEFARIRPSAVEIDAAVAAASLRAAQQALVPTASRRMFFVQLLILYSDHCAACKTLDVPIPAAPHVDTVSSSKYSRSVFSTHE